MHIPIPIHQLPHAQGLDLPAFATPHSAGMDLRAALPEGETWSLAPGERKLVPTGLVMALPEGFEAQIRPRSGLSLKHGITVLNSPGTIDADYRGEIKVALINLGETAFTVEPGMRIAQAVLAQVPVCVWHESAKLPETDRGEGGFGSTGVHKK